MKKKIENNNGVTAIYVRRSVADRDNNSLSIESQKEDCIKYIGEDCVYRIYCDNGFSVNLRDYLNVSDELDKSGVSVYSLSEPFNTSSREGRMMRNNLLNLQSLNVKRLPQEWLMRTAQEDVKRAFIMAVQ